jgi:hypothetical protein
LHDDDLVAAYVLHDFHADLTVAKSADADASERRSEVARDFARKRWMGVARKQRQRARIQGDFLELV